MNQRLTDIRRAQLDQLLSGGTNMAGGGLLKAVVKAAKPAAKAVTKVAEAAPQAEALRLAQQRAALPPAKGGLGLAANNTPEQRAAAMGINTDAYHGTKQDIKGAFVPGYNDDLAFVTKDPDFASKWVGKGKMQKRVGAEAEQKSAEDLYRALKHKHMDFESLDRDDPNFHAEYDKRNNAFKEAFAKEAGLDPDRTHSAVYPMKVEANKTFNPETDMDVMAEYFAKNNTPQEIVKHFQHGNYLVYENQPVVDFLKSKGYDSMRLRESTDDNFPTIAVFNPETIRSRFAAFDPFRKTAATAAAMGVAAPDLLAKEQDKAQGGLVNLAGGGAPKKADSEYTLMGAPRQDNENKPYPKTERMNLGVKAVKSGLDKLNRLIDTGPSVRDVLGNVVGAVPFVGPDLRKGMEDSTLTIPYEFQRSETNPRVATGVNTAKVPTTDILDALKMSDITGGTGASNLLGSVGKGYAPNPMDVLDTLGLGVAGYGAAKAGAKGAKLAGRGALRALEQAGTGPTAGSMAAQRGAVKLGGGNWVDSEVKRSLGRLKQDESYPQSAIESAKEDLKEVKKEAETWSDLGEQNIMLNTVAQLQRDIDHMEHTNAFNKWVDTKAGSYVRNQMATPDDPVLKMLDVRSAKIEADYQAGQKRLAKLDERIAQAEGSANTPEEQNTLANLKRTRSQRAAEIESDRELAMTSMLPGGKDYAGYDFLKNDAADLINTREEAGFPIAGYGQSDPAKAWEAVADLTAQPIDANRLQGQAEKIAASKAAAMEYGQYVNVELPDKFRAYLDTTELSDKEKQALMHKTPKTMMVEILGDRERSTALWKARDDASKQANVTYYSMAEENPYLAKLPPDATVYNSLGLGDLGIYHIIDVLKDDVASGKLKLEDLNKITMDQAVKRAAEYDFEMAKKARDSVAQSRASMPVYKEYPEGYKWVQLTKPGEFNAESNAMGHSVRGYEPERGHPDWTPESGDSGSEYYGHGGWEAIKSGQAKVYSLVDPNGNPHTTIEVMASSNPYPVSGEAFARLSPAEKAQFREHVMQWRRRNPDVEELTDEHTTQALKEAGVPPQPDIITQIKGKGNARPAEKYDPYTQDFVRSGNWADVEDLRNTGLSPISRDYLGHTSSWVPEAEDVKHLTRQQRMEALAKAIDAGDLPEKGYVTRSELDESLRKHGKPTYAEDTDELLRQLQPPETPDEPNMAGGGLLSKLGKAAKAARAADELVPAAGRMRFADQPRGGLNVVKETGGNWLGGDVEQALKPLKRGVVNEEAARRLMGDAFTDERMADPVNNAINKWVDSNLTNYVKKQMATPDDPVRKLAEEGVAHMPIIEVDTNRNHARGIRKMHGSKQMGQSEAAKSWEDVSDISIYPGNVGEIKRVKEHGGPGADKYEPWMEKADPNTVVSRTTRNFNTRDLGFDHIVDVLRQDVREGRIRPEQLSKVSMEQAVRRTYEYDQEMAKKMRETQAKVTEGMPVHKEYPEGYKWIELTQPKVDPKKELPEGFHLEDTEDGLVVMNDRTGEIASPELAAALKYEGETMGHCVGGYCPDVLAGRSRIYSLRDAKGEPHVTVEVEPGHPLEGHKNLNSAEKQELHNQVVAEHYGGREPDLTNVFSDLTNYEKHPYFQKISEAYVNKYGMPAPSIQQIKGKQNRAPKEEYLPFVQDFVKSGKWSDVNELRNAGLRDIEHNPRLKEYLKKKGSDVPRYLTENEHQGYTDDFLMDTLYPKDETPLPPEQGMAGGGLLSKIGKAAKAAEKIMPTARIGLEAPGIIIPSKMNNVREAVRNIKGNYGARRVERAADEIPNLENMFQEDALKEAFTGDNARGMMTISPADFEKYAQELSPRAGKGIAHGLNVSGNAASFEDRLMQQALDKYDLPTDEYIQYLQQLQGGFSDVPYLNLFKDEVGLPDEAKVIGHEGRHRNRALAAKGDKSTLVQIQPRGDLREGMPRRTQEDFIEALRQELDAANRLVVPESEPYFRRPSVQLPDVYAKGGEVNGLKNALNNLLRTDKPEAHMALGGITNVAKVAGKAAKAPAVIPNLLRKSTASEIGREERALRQAAAQAEEARVAAAKQTPVPVGYVTHTEKSLNPHVGFRFEADQPVGIKPSPKLDVGALERAHKGASMLALPWDSTSRNVRVSGVSGEKLAHDIWTHGGIPYSSDEEHLLENIGGASGRAIASRIQNRELNARAENKLLGGTGEILQAVNTMGPGGENYALPSSEFIFDVINRRVSNGQLTFKQAEELSDEVRNWVNPRTKKQPFKNWAGFISRDGAEQMYTGEGLNGPTGDLRKVIADKMVYKKKKQELLDFNAEDLINAITHEPLRGVDRGYIGGNLLSNVETSPMKLSKATEFPWLNPYDTNFSATHVGQLEDLVPIRAVMSRKIAPIEQEFLAKQAAKKDGKPYTPDSLEASVISALEKRKDNVAQFMDSRFFQDLNDYMEALNKPLEKKKGGLAQTKKVKRHGNTVPH